MTKITRQDVQGTTVCTLNVTYLSQSTVSTLKAEVSALLDVPTLNLVFDLSPVTMIDSSGFGWLISVSKIFAKKNKTLQLVVSDPKIVRLFKISGLEPFFSFNESVGQACLASAQENTPNSFTNHNSETLSTPEFNLGCQEIDGIVIISIAGDFNSDALPLVKKTIPPLVAEKTVRGIILDCEKLNFISSQGIGVIAELAFQCSKIKQPMTMCSLPKQLTHVLFAVGLPNVCAVYNTKSEALASYVT